MVFNSYIFMLFFLPVCFSGYFLLNKIEKYEWAKCFLVGMSWWFYGYYNVSYLSIMISSIVINYILNHLIMSSNSKGIKRGLMSLGVVGNIGVLFYFKYFNFFMENMNQVFKFDYVAQNIILPLGISFFTFQQVSYIIDSYRGEVPKYRFIDYALFVSFFPQLVAGPIVLHSEMIPQFQEKKKKRMDVENISKGLMALSFGLAKKVLIADTFGRLVNMGYADVSILNTTSALLVILGYTLQIYFDFSGYCDMATGIALMFNIKLPVNFNSPYRAKSVNEFWDRWHMTLTRFFTRYVYIPLGGNRKSKMRTYINIMIVFSVSGLWHGAGWSFVLWGGLHGIVCIVERMGNKYLEKVNAVIRWFLTFGFVNLCWIYFRAENITIANHMIQKVFSLDFGNVPAEWYEIFIFPELQWLLNILGLSELFRTNCIWLVLALFYGFAVFASAKMKNTQEKMECFKPTIRMEMTVVGLLTWSILSFAGVSTFLYFGF